MVQLQELIQEIEKTLRKIIREEIPSSFEGREETPALEKLPERDRLLNRKEAADYCRISEITLWRMRQDSAIGSFRVGNRLLYSVEKHLIPFLESRERKPSPRRSVR